MTSRDDNSPDATGEWMIRLDGVSKQYPDGTVAVHDLDLQVRRGELIALLGPSGCGKSTTLRMVNRLVEPSSGRIVLDGRDVTGVDPVQLRRGIGYVIQRIGLFPHLSVRANVTTVPSLLGWDGGRTRTRADEMLELVGLDPGVYGNRYPHELSGGQQQRVGVARALAADPPVLLMDEPFGAVDPVQRERLQAEFRRIQAELHKTVLFVTHDVDEAVRLADRIAVFSQGGVLEQVADPATLLARPVNEQVADFVGTDRAIRRMSVTRLVADDLEPSNGSGHAAGGQPADTVRVGSSLRDAFVALLARPDGRLPVLDGDGRPAGVLTPDGVAAALRRLPPEG